MNMGGSSQRQVLVTGGTSGIGRATALAFSQAGHEVIATGLMSHEIEACRANADFHGIDVQQLDVADPQAIERLIGQCGRLDVLVNAAGVPRGTNEFVEADFLRTLDINLNGTMRCCYAARSLLAENGGCIVNIASLMSYFGSATGPAYAASKGAVVQLTKSLAVAWAPQGIRCNAVAPGWINTPMTQPMQTDVERYGRVLSRTPMNRWGEPEEIARAILFLASADASFITGVVLPVDGGYLAQGV